VEGAWKELLRGPSSAGHAVQIYADIGELADSVVDYLDAGFEAGEPAVLVATAEHASHFAEGLASRGWNMIELEQQGLLATADADATLAAFMVDASPSPARFERVVGGLLDRVGERHPERRTRAFGEMVDLLCLRGEPEAALALEQLWNRLARTRNFSLLCGYQLDVFDRASQAGTLPGICDAHSHVLPALDPARFARAVDLALEEVLGPGEAGKVYVLIGEQIRQHRVPVPQLALMWVSEHMPVLADRILASARAHYGAQPAALAT
jgi:KaiC/GvpD/RAD55 family RecA-like ATPase